jgi:putative membrane protein
MEGKKNLILLYTVIGFLIIFHLVGWFNFVFGANPQDFARLTPINLILSLIGILIFCPLNDNSFKLKILIIGLIGFSSELIGVNTGILYGHYSYSDKLGLKLLGVPIILFINWVLVIVSIHAVLNYIFSRFKFSVSYLVLAFIGASILVLYDYALEPFAIKYHLWSWDLMFPPLFNYISWFGISFLNLLILSKWIVNKTVYLVGLTIIVLEVLFFFFV